MKKAWMISSGIALLDQGIKVMIRRTEPGSIFAEIPGFVEISYSINPGAAFSMFSGQALWLAALSIALMLTLCVYVCRKMCLTISAEIALYCLLGGGIGNLIDRIVYRGVTDYIKLLWFDFPVFNLADVAITVSAAVLFVLLFFGKLEKNTGECDGSMD